MAFGAKNGSSAGMGEMYSSQLQQDALLQRGLLLAVNMASGLECGQGVRLATDAPPMLDVSRHVYLLGNAISGRVASPDFKHIICRQQSSVRPSCTMLRCLQLVTEASAATPRAVPPQQRGVRPCQHLSRASVGRQALLHVYLNIHSQ